MEFELLASHVLSPKHASRVQGTQGTLTQFEQSTFARTLPHKSAEWGPLAQNARALSEGFRPATGPPPSTSMSNAGR